jgi:hypothetical protein
MMRRKAEEIVDSIIFNNMKGVILLSIANRLSMIVDFQSTAFKSLGLQPSVV